MKSILNRRKKYMRMLEKKTECSWRIEKDNGSLTPDFIKTKVFYPISFFPSFQFFRHNINKSYQILSKNLNSTSNIL